MLLIAAGAAAGTEGLATVGEFAAVAAGAEDAGASVDLVLSADLAGVSVVVTPGSLAIPELAPSPPFSADRKSVTYQPDPLS